MENEKEAKKTEPHYPDGGYGWVIVGAIIIINVSLLTLVPCFGLIFRDEFKAWDVSSAQTSFLLHLHSSLYCMFGFFTSPFLKLYGMRPVAFIGASLMCLGILLSSFAASYVYLLFSTAVLIGLGQGIVMPATYLAIYTYFKKRLTIATSLTVTSASVAPIILSKVLVLFLKSSGRKFTILVLFVMSLFSLIGCGLLRPLRRKEGGEVEKELLKEKEGLSNGAPLETSVVINEDVSKNALIKDEPLLTPVYKDTTVPAQTSTVWSKIFNVFDLHLLRDVPLVIVIIGLGISFASELNIVLMIQFMLRDLSLFDSGDVATAMSVQSLADIFGRLAIPLASHCMQVPAKYMYVSALVVASTGRTVLSIWPTKRNLVFTTIAILGVTKGMRAVFQSVILPKYVSLDKIPAANGINMLFTGFVSLIVGPLIGLFHDKLGSYVYSLHAGSALSLACAVLLTIESIFSKKWTKNSDIKY
ncbi:monocarboxylate transporter 13-like [Anthonomus grandis grandis]|uniref:monocarboxylate transporter 13-like n=1 Tax=Anthonomus grandis grandis TaxID=2921223 RepID=UPI0021668E6E|nr:monocarboxylate transporter 13-like [Anthonomus grandis grandis]XP_050308084.1 monocarboxylate transporter 13-like [Anthonomus grandis grandis]XP_050308085.1 monocarboxylate transporter 13-like [Anthonomus grandis grandis]